MSGTIVPISSRTNSLKAEGKKREEDRSLKCKKSPSSTFNFQKRDQRENQKTKFTPTRNQKKNKSLTRDECGPSLRVPTTKENGSGKNKRSKTQT